MRTRNICMIIGVLALLSNRSIIADGDFTAQLKQTQAGVSKRILKDIETVEIAIGEMAFPSDEKAPLLKTLREVEKYCKSNPYPKKLKGFRAIIPFHSEHAKVFSVYSAVLREDGYKGLHIWKINKFDYFKLFDRPKREALDKLYLEIMRNERRSEAFNVTNCTGKSRTVTVNLSRIPAGCETEVFYTVFVDTKRGFANPSALMRADKEKNSWSFKLPSGMTTQVWIKIYSKNAKAGEYKIPIKVSSGKTVKQFPFVLKILPITFPDVPDYNLMMYDYAVSCGRAITPKNQKAAIKDLCEHLVSMFLIGANDIIRISRSDYDDRGNLITKPDIKPFAKAMKLVPARIKYWGFFLNLPAQKGHYKFAGFPPGSKAGENALKNWLKYLEQACKKLKVDPKRITLMPYDEPRKNEAFKAVYEFCKVVKENSPFTTYCTTGARGAKNPYCAKSLKYLDISHPCRRHYLELTPRLRKIFDNFSKKPGREFWLYDCGYKRGYEYYVIGGWVDVLNGATGSGYWSYCDTGDNPSNWNMYPYYRRKRDNYAPEYIDETSITTSREWESIMESVENGEYVLMLKKKIKELKKSGRDVTQLEKLVSPVSVPKTLKESEALRLKILHNLVK